MTKILYLPIERVTRELESRKVVKKYFEKKGFKIRMLNSVYFHTFFPFFKPGYVWENDITYQSNKLLKSLFFCGYKVFTSDEEAYGDYSVKLYFKQRFFIDNLNYIEHHFFKGAEDLDYFRSNYEAKFFTKVSTASNYRFTPHTKSQNKGVLNIVKELKIAKNQFKKIVLISSKFSMVNRIDKTFDINSIIFKRTKKFNLNNDSKELVSKHLYYCKELFEYCLEDYYKLVLNCKDILFIIRHHPGEDFGIWKEKFSRLENVIFKNSYTFIEWAKSVDLVIHNGSTSGLESFLIKKPTIYYNPLIFDENLVNNEQKISSLYISNFNDLYHILLSKVFFEDYIERYQRLQSIIDFKNDFSSVLFQKISYSEPPSYNIINRFSYVFSKLYFYRLFIFWKKKISKYEY
jgi:surface carbohydrate biosynthesis protein